MDNSIPNIPAEDIAKTKSIAWLSYLAILFLIPMLSDRNSEYVKFHVNQGIVLFLLEILVNIAGWILGLIPIVGGLIYGLLGLAVFILAVLGIVNAASGRVARLPIIGGITLYK